MSFSFDLSYASIAVVLFPPTNGLLREYTVCLLVLVVAAILYNDLLLMLICWFLSPLLLLNSMTVLISLSFY